MKFLVALFLCASLPDAFAAPSDSLSQTLQRRQYAPEDNSNPYSGRHRWIPASQINGASRTSCPFLNTAANHAFLPRDGRRISIAQFDQAIVDSLNFSPAFAHIITTTMLGKLGVITNDTVADANLRLDLEQTNAHGKTEHDASITRLDQIQGDTIPVQANLVQDFLDDTLPITYPYLNSTSIGRTRVRRERESLRLGNPPLSNLFFSSSQGEAGLILTIMGDDNGAITAENAEMRRAPKDRVKAFLLEERFPTELGYKRPERIIEQKENGFVVQSVGAWQAWMTDSGVVKSPEVPKGQGGAKGNGYFVVGDEGFGLH